MSEKVLVGRITVDRHREALRAAVELGYKWCEKGMNLEAALAKFDEVYYGKERK